MANESIVVLTTIDKKSNATELAKLLINEKLAACINIIKIEKSVFRWKGQIYSGTEYLLIIKTTEKKYTKLEAKIKNSHPYTVPEIIALPIKRGNKHYLAWLSKST